MSVLRYVIAAAALLGAVQAQAREIYSCAAASARYLGNGRCSDGTIAIYRGTVPDDPVPAPPPARRVNPGQGLIGAWSTSVGGAVWTSPSYFPGWATLHVSPGALAGLLVIYPDGRYVWNAWGGKRDSWSYSQDPEYPILLQDSAERRTWKVGFNRRNPRSIYIVEGNGYFYYVGKKP